MKQQKQWKTKIYLWYQTKKQKHTHTQKQIVSMEKFLIR